jgi:hypothetical protein
MWTHTVSNFMLHKKLPKNDMVRLQSTKCDGWEDCKKKKIYIYIYIYFTVQWGMFISSEEQTRTWET